MDGSKRRELIERYKEGASAVSDALAPFSSPAGLHRIDETGWTPAQRIHLLAETEMVEGMRLRRILQEEQPAFTEPASRPAETPGRDVDASLAVFQSAVQANAALAGRLNEDDWQRFGVINGSRYSVEDWLLKRSGFAHEQAAAIARAARRSAV